MWRRADSSRIERHARVRLRVYRRDPELRRASGLAVESTRGPERVAERMSRRVRHVGELVRRVARNGLAQFLRVGRAERMRANGRRKDARR